MANKIKQLPQIYRQNVLKFDHFQKPIGKINTPFILDQYRDYHSNVLNYWIIGISFDFAKTKKNPK